MGTLHLKKKPAPEFPSVVGQYAVMRQSDGKAMRFTKFHPTRQSAITEADRLRSENPEKRFLVLEVIE